MKEPIKNVKSFSESEILKTLNAYMIITGAGLISMRLYNPPYADDPAERAKIEAGMKAVEGRIEADMDPYKAARQMDTDEIVPAHELRDYLMTLVEMCYQSYGYRRVKNPRIWSMHDLNVLSDFTG